MAWVYVDQQFFLKSGVVWLKKNNIKYKSNTIINYFDLWCITTEVHGLLLIDFRNIVSYWKHLQQMVGMLRGHYKKSDLLGLCKICIVTANID